MPMILVRSGFREKVLRYFTVEMLMLDHMSLLFQNSSNDLVIFSHTLRGGTQKYDVCFS